jgi:hypothetical protein
MGYIRLCLTLVVILMNSVLILLSIGTIKLLCCKPFFQTDKSIINEFLNCSLSVLCIIIIIALTKAILGL